MAFMYDMCVTSNGVRIGPNFPVVKGLRLHESQSMEHTTSASAFFLAKLENYLTLELNIRSKMNSEP